MRERDEANHKLHLEETKRKSLEQRARASEEETKQLHSLLEEARRRSAELEAESAEQEYRTRRAKEEMDGLQRLLEATRSQAHENQSGLHQANIELERARSDFSNARQRKEQLEGELANTHEAVGAARRAASQREEDNAELRARVQAMEQELRNQQMRLAQDLQHKEDEATRLRQRLTNYEVQLPAVTQERDMALEETKHVRRQLEAETEARLHVESLRVNEQVDIRKALQTSQQALEDRNRELAKVKEDYQRVVEAHRLEAQRTADLNACVGPLQKQLVQAQTLAGDATRQARDTIGEMETRCRVLAEKFEAEKRRNGDVTRELGAAYEAARILQVRNKGVEAVRPVNHHLADLVEWKEQALRTLQSQRAALNAMSQTQNQTHARIAAVRGGAFDPKEA